MNGIIRHVALGALVAMSATALNAQGMQASHSSAAMTVAALKAKLNTLLSEQFISPLLPRVRR